MNDHPDVQAAQVDAQLETKTELARLRGEDVAAAAGLGHLTDGAPSNPPPTPDETPAPPPLAQKGELLPWRGRFWRVISQVELTDGKGNKGQGVVIVPGPPTNGAIKRELRRQQWLLSHGTKGTSRRETSTGSLANVWEVTRA